MIYALVISQWAIMFVYCIARYVILRREAKQRERAQAERRIERVRLREMAKRYGVGFDESRSNEINAYRIEVALRLPDPVSKAMSQMGEA